MLPETLTIRQRYHTCNRTELASLIERTLEQKDDNPDLVWRALLIDYCLKDLRPGTWRTKVKDWCRWLAFVLRYIQPLATNQPPLATEPFIMVLRQRPDVIRALMFGTHDQMRLAIQVAYDLRDDYRSRLAGSELSQEQQGILDNVRKEIQSQTERTLTGWSRYYLGNGKEALANLIYGLFHPDFDTTPPNVIQMIEQVRQQRIFSDARFEACLNRAIAGHASMGVVSQALGYVNEYERRSAMQLTYSRWFVRAASLLAVCLAASVILLLPLGAIGQLVVAICWLLGAADLLLVVVLLVVLFVYAHDSYTWANTALKTLDILLRPIGVDANVAGNSTDNSNP